MSPRRSQNNCWQIFLFQIQLFELFQWFGNHQILQAQRASLPYTPKLFLGSFIQITETFYFNIQTSFYLNQPVPKLGASNIIDKLKAEDDTFNLVDIIVELNKDGFSHKPL